MKNTISIKREFSIDNPKCIQFIMEMSNGDAWSIAQIGAGSTWDVVRVEFDFEKNSIMDVHWNNTQLPNLLDVRDFIWRKTNNIELGQEDK